MNKSLNVKPFFAVALLLILSLPAVLWAAGKKETGYAGEAEQARTDTVQQEIPAAEARPEIVQVFALNGPSGIGMAYLFENAPDLAGVKPSFSLAAAPDLLLPKLIKGEADIGILPINAAAKVYTANKGSIVLGGIAGQGMLNIISRDISIKTLADLRGKKLNAAGQGATPEYLIRYLAAKENIKIGSGPDSIELDFSISAAEIAPALIAKKINYALVPEPFSTLALMSDPAIQRILDMQKLYREASGLDAHENYPMTALVIRKAFADAYPETVRRFLSAYKASIEWTNANPQKAGELTEKHTLGLKAGLAARAVPNSAFVWQSASEAQKGVEGLLSLFMLFAPESIGGKLPDSGFYFK